MRYPLVLGACAVSFAGCAASLADIVPISRTTSLSVSWSQGSTGFPPSTGGDNDSYTGFGNYSHTLSGNSSSASQTSYLLSNGAFAQVSGYGFRNTSVMQPFSSSGRSTFIYTFMLDASTTLYFNGLLSRGSPFIGMGTVRLYDNATNIQLYEPSLAGLGQFELQRAFSDTLAVGAGFYRLEVRGGNDGTGGGAPTGDSIARVMMTTPTPGATSIALLGGLAALRRRR